MSRNTELREKRRVSLLMHVLNTWPNLIIFLNLVQAIFVNNNKFASCIIFSSKELSFATNQNCLIPTSLQPDGANLWYFKFRIRTLSDRMCSKYQSSTTSGCRDIGINESEFVAKFLSLFSLFYHVNKVEDIKTRSNIHLK